MLFGEKLRKLRREKEKNENCYLIGEISTIVLASSNQQSEDIGEDLLKKKCDMNCESTGESHVDGISSEESEVKKKKIYSCQGKCELGVKFYEYMIGEVPEGMLKDEESREKATDIWKRMFKKFE